MLIKHILSLSVSAALSLCTVSAPANAGYQQIIAGDINNDGEFNSADLAIMGLYLKGKADISGQGFANADINCDGCIDSLDLVSVRHTIQQIQLEKEAEKSTITTIDPTAPPYYATTTTVSTAETALTTTTVPNFSSYDDWLSYAATSSAPVTTQAAFSQETAFGEFIKSPLDNMYGSLPSQGSGRVCILYVDFPDCPYEWEPTAEKIEECAFGIENSENPEYPHESINAFYRRSSKHTVNLSGKAFRYTTSQKQYFYENDASKTCLIDEILNAMNEYVDFNSFDANGDKVIDSILISVPKAAGSDEWWPCASMYSGSYIKTLDGLKVGSVVVGNAEIKSDTDCVDFVSTYIHELGHCMGLPDYYLYNNKDAEGLHGSAGFDTMEEVYSDFSCLSKLLLGWYRKEQVQVYDGSDSVTYTLGNAQTENGNCIVIPCGESSGSFLSEFFILEYTTLGGNNLDIPKKYWWMSCGSGVRVLHAEASAEETPSGIMLKYRSGNNIATNYNLGKRLVRLPNDSNYDNLFHDGSVIDSSVGGFGFYDEYGLETIDPNVRIKVKKADDDSYTITIERLKNG